LQYGSIDYIDLSTLSLFPTQYLSFTNLLLDMVRGSRNADRTVALQCDVSVKQYSRPWWYLLSFLYCLDRLPRILTGCSEMDSRRGEKL